MDCSIGTWAVRRVLFVLFFLLFTSCYKNHLFVQQESVDGNDLASFFVKTPDPRKAHPPIGQKILVGWDFPRALFLEELDHLTITVHFWDQEEKKIEHPIDRRRGYASFFFSNPTKDPVKKILTYKVEIFKKDQTILETWKHHFWTELITANKELEETPLSQ
jgi:hypothetical protein